MAEQQQQPGELALVKAVRSLDQGGSEAIPDKLDQIWKILSIYPGGKFHAAQEMLVRWLLKNMNGSSEDAQKLRRYPLAWAILGKVFTSIPLFSLAKSLADRRFVPILQSTLNDVSKPIEVADQKQTSDTEMADADSDQARPRKKKRAETVTFDLETQSNKGGCIRTAKALFEAVQLLLDRLEPKASSDAMRDNHMGAEHIKSLFCSSASDIKDLILSALLVCKFIVDIKESNDDLEDWVFTICSLWDLHLQGEGDALLVATYIAPPAISMIAKVPSLIPLKQFLSRNLILPARAAFLNKGDLEIIRQTVQSTIGFSTVSCPVILDLALSSASLAGSQTAKRNNDTWTQGVFSVLDETLQASRSARKFAAVEKMLGQIKTHKVSVSVDSLRSVCRNYVLQAENTDWDILVGLAEVNANVFIGDDDLLQVILNRLSSKAPEHADEGPWGKNSRKRNFMDLIAGGFVEARDPSAFVKIWFQHLAAVEPHLADGAGPDQDGIWYHTNYGNIFGIIARSLEKTMNVKQILSLVDWLDSQVDQPAENATVILLLEAISREINVVDVADAVSMRLFHILSERSLPSPVNKTVVSRKWALARRCLQWARLEQGQEIWASSVSQLRDPLANLPLTDDDAFEAFKFAVAGWVANYPGGKYEDDAAEVTLSALSRLNKEAVFPRNSRAEHLVMGYLTDVEGGDDDFADRDGCPRLLSMILERGGDKISGLLRSALSFVGGGDTSPISGIGRISSIFANENNTNSRVTMDTVLKLVYANIRDSLGENHRLVAEALLAVPEEAITREHREELMALLAVDIAATADIAKTVVGGYGALHSATPIVSLMVKLMRKPTFYIDMAFTDIDNAAMVIANSVNYTPDSHLQFLPLVEELAALTIKQMTANVGAREEKYFRLAISAMEERMRPAPGGCDYLTEIRIVLLKSLILAVRESAALKAANLNVRELEHHLVEMIESVVEQFCSKWEKQSAWNSDLPSVSAVLESAEDLYQRAAADNVSGELKKALSPYLPRLRDASQKLGSQRQWDTWALCRYLAKASDEDETARQNLGQNTGGTTGDEKWTSAVSDYGNKEGLLNYVDDLTANTDDNTRLKYIETLLLRRLDAPNQPAHLLAVHRIIQQLGGKTHPQGAGTAREAEVAFDLATVHTILCKRLRSTELPEEFALIIRILETILDDKSNSMTQWNIELTLSTVSVLASEVTTHKVMSCVPKAYEWLCRLVQVIVRKHRLRLEGHFHLLVTVLQSLLRTLICHPSYSSHPGQKGCKVWTTGLIKYPTLFPHWQKHAKALGRLLTMVCEPTPGSVARSQQNSLDSATDAAKRYAGQHMYLVLMLYIKLQLEQNVPHDVREALEPGVFAILDITTPEARRVTNDALDGSGRTIMKHLYKQYLKFGKWSGI